MMKKIFLIVLFTILSNHLIAQNIKKDWILIKIEDLSRGAPITESIKYTRYFFTGSNVYVSYYPGWYSEPYPSALSGADLTVGYANYTLEKLTDTSLVFAKDGFKRFTLISEERFVHQKQRHDTTTSLNGNKVYIGDNYLTPRLKRQYLMSDFIKMSDYNIRKETVFNAKFVVSDKGKIERVDIVNGINSGYNQEFKNLIMKTSGKWEPALLNNKPVYSEITYTIHYLNSIVPD